MPELTASTREPARRLGVSDTAIHKAERAGRIARESDDMDIARRLALPSSVNWFGTDETGRDVDARLMHGAGTTIGIVGAAVFLAALIGGATGAIAGFFGRLGDMALSRGADALLAFPPIILGVVVAAPLGPGAVNLTLALGIICAPVFSTSPAPHRWPRESALLWRPRAPSATTNGRCCCGTSHRMCCRRYCCNA